MKYIAIFLSLLVALSADDKINNSDEVNDIVIESSTPLEDMKETDLKRFVDEGIISNDEARNFNVGSNEDDDFSNKKPLVSIYKHFADSSQPNSKGDSAKEKDSNVDKNSNQISNDNYNSTDTFVKNPSNEVPSLLENIYGHIGFFGKSNVLNHSVGGSYGIATGSVGLTYNFKRIVFVDIGIYGVGKLSGHYNENILQNPNIKHSDFVTHRANIKYVATDSSYNELFDITLGRFQENRDWIKNYAQGMKLNVNYGWLKVWLDWLDDQAYVNREYVTDFDIFKQAYNNQWLIAGGLGLSAFGIDMLPYYYYLNDNFWAAGGKLENNIKFASKAWSNRGVLHYAYLNNKREFMVNEDKKSQILWIEEMFKYRNTNKSVSFGAGYVQVWGSYFELANIGNMSRFETYNNQDYGIMSPGGIDDSPNSTNMFFANTRTIYGFVGFRIGDFAMMLLGRNSVGDSSYLLAPIGKIRQDQYSLGGRYKIVDGLYIGGIATFMMENRVNKSYAKGYLEFRI